MRTLAFLILLLIVSFSTQSQDLSSLLIEDVILLNSKPYLVRMTEKGKIMSFEQELKDNYAALNAVVRKEIDPAKIETELAVIEVPEINNAKSTEKDNELGEAVIEDMEEEMKELNSSEVSYDYEFSFNHRDATLSGNTISQLALISEILNDNPEVNCKIESYFAEDVDVSKILSRNRSNAIKELLLSKGIASSRILIMESDNDDWANNQVKLSIH